MSAKRYKESISEKVIIGGMTKRLECYYDKGEYLAGKSTTIVLDYSHLKYITAVLNSTLMTFYYKVFFNSMSLAGGFYRIGAPQIKTLPIAIPADIRKEDNLLIVSKDSIGRNIDRLDQWLKGEKELYLIVDEAHHSTAKTYRKVIDYVKKKVPNVKLIGLTATPFRTAEAEQGLLAKIYSDGVKNGQVVHGDIGITYQIGLKELINRQILAKPIFESYYTDEAYGDSLGVDAWESIQHLDILPDEVAQQMADSAARNKLIVETYKNNQKQYGQTILFAVNVVHATLDQMLIFHVV